MNSKIALIAVGILLSAIGPRAQTVEPQPVELELGEDIEMLSNMAGGAWNFRRSGSVGVLHKGFSCTMFNLSNPREPSIWRHVSFPNYVNSSVFAEEWLFYPELEADGVTHWGTLKIPSHQDPFQDDILPENIKSLRAEKGNYHRPWLYLACGEDGLAIVNFADSTAPELSIQILAQDFLLGEEWSSALNVVIEDADITSNGFVGVLGRGYFSTPPQIRSFLSTVDVTDPNQPRITGFSQLESMVIWTRLSPFRGNRILAPVDGGVDVFGVSDEGLLSKLGEIIPEGRGNSWTLMDPTLDGDTLYAAYFTDKQMPTYPVLAYDISDPSKPELKFGDPVAKTSPLGSASWTTLVDNVLYAGGAVTNYYDIRDLDEGVPKYLGNVDSMPGYPFSLGGEGSILQIRNAWAHFYMYNFTQPNLTGFLDTTLPPTLIHYPPASWFFSNIANFGNYALVEKQVFDITDPYSIEERDKLSISIPDTSTGELIPQASISVAHNCAHGRGVYVLVDVKVAEDVYTPYLVSYALDENPPLRQIEAVQLPIAPRKAALGDRYLVVGSGTRPDATERGTGKVAVYDIGDPASSRLLGTVETGAVDALAIDDSRFYVAMIGDVGDQNIFAYDIMDDGSITQLPQYISLDEAFADYAGDFADIGFPELSLQATETYLIARDKVLYGGFSQRGRKGSISSDRHDGNSIVAAFLTESFGSSIVVYRTKSRTPTSLIGISLREDRIFANNFWAGITQHRAPMRHSYPDEEPQSIGVATPLEGTLAYSGEVDTYKLKAYPEQYVTIAVEAAEGSTLDPIVELVDGLGKLLAVNDDGPNRPDSLLKHTLPTFLSGEFNSPFRIRVTAPSGPPNRTVGDYSITLTLGEEPVPEPTPTPTPIITAEDFELSSIQTVRRTNGVPVTFTIQVRTNPERDGRDWSAELTAEVDWAGATYFEPPTIEPPTVSFPGTATLTLVPSADFLNLSRRTSVNVDVLARLVVGSDETDDPIVQTLDWSLVVDLIPAHRSMDDFDDTYVETISRESAQIYITTTSDLSENQIDETVSIHGRLSPFNPVASFIDVSLNVEAANRTETLKGNVRVRGPSGDFETSFKVKGEDELGSGHWVVHSEFDELSLVYNPVKGKSPKLHIPVGHLAQSSAKVGGTDGPIPGVGRAVVAFGPAPNALLETGWQAMYESAISLLRARRFTETTLKGFCAAEDSPATLADLQSTLAASSDADLLTLVLAGPNDSDSHVSMKLSSSEVLTPSQIGPLVKARHDALEAAGKEGQTVVIIDTHRAGLFREEMRQDDFERFVDGPDGYVLTCTGNGQYNVAFNAMDTETGEFVSYLRFLIDAIAKGYPLGDAHEQATSSLTRLQGGLVLSYPQPIRSEMSDDLRGIFLGSSFLPDPRNLPDRNAPRIVETCANQTLDEDDVPLLFVVAEDESTINTNASQLSVYAVITAPPDGVHPPAQTVVTLPYKSQTQRHELTLNDFPRAQFGDTSAGDYAVGLYVKDAAGNRSTVSSLTITTLDTSVSTWGRF